MAEMAKRFCQVAAPRARLITMRSIALTNSGMRSSVLGFGCSAMMGRVGRKASLAALAAACDAGITFFDTARSYGYGESEALLGEFLHGRRDSVLISTKFGILPTPTTHLKRSLKPVARTLLRLAPGARKAMQQQLAAQSSPSHFSVAALHKSIETSLRTLRTGYVDFLFLHEAPASVLQRQDLFAALDQLVAAGKLRRYGIASPPEVIEAARTTQHLSLQTIQLPCNLFNMDQTLSLAHQLNPTSDAIIIANHPFGGASGIHATNTLLTSLAAAPETPTDLRKKLHPIDDATIADVVLNAITCDTSIQIVVPSMLHPAHLRANIAAIEHSRFTPEELHWLRAAISKQIQRATHKA
jgi:aryl-alcohol dehydrogenase-like predicted oxidoreductase